MNWGSHFAWSGPGFPHAEPRKWQSEALAVSVEAMRARERSVVQAVMGSGKADFAAELVWISVPGPHETIVVSAPFRFLVRQLAETVASRIGGSHVGLYYGDVKQPERSVIVACHDSLGSLASDLRALRRTVGLWISDECHRTENVTVKDAVEILRPAHQIGLTATPYLADKRSKLGLWDRQIYSYDATQAMRDGVIVPWRLVEWTGADLDFELACLHMAQDADGPGVVNAETIEDAEYFAKLAHEFGLNCAAVHSENPLDQNMETLEQLRVGDLSFVVHVSMLQEGVNLPWLRWLLLRRQTQSRVRFAQEVGRVLRSHPGKDYATIYDPNSLFSIFKNLTVEACLSGGHVEKAPEERDHQEAVEAAALDLFEAVTEGDEPEQERILRGLRPAEAYLRALVISLDAAGAISQKVASSSMRRDPPTEKQVNFARKLRKVIDASIVDGLPDKHAQVLRYACSQAFALNRGAVSDLISILLGLRKAQSWPILAETMTTHLI